MSNLMTGNLLRKLREDFGYSQKDVARLIGVSNASVAKWEAGDYIKTENLYYLAKLYDVSFSELYKGKLKNETTSDFWKRNYDLDNFKIDEEVIQKDINKVKTLFEHISLIRNTFVKKLLRWAKDELSGEELEEFKFIKKYFRFDVHYYALVRKTLPIFLIKENDEKDFILEIYIRYANYGGRERKDWELSKIYDFVYDYNKNLILESNNMKAVEYMLSSFSQIEKDLLLHGNIHIEEKIEKEVNPRFGNGKITELSVRDRSVDEIETIPIVKVIINSGANWIHSDNHPHKGWNEEQLNFSESKKVFIDNSFEKKYEYYNYGGDNQLLALANWKEYSYEQYLELVDNVETERLKDIVNLRESNPLEYFNRMIERGFLQ